MNYIKTLEIHVKELNEKCVAFEVGSRKILNDAPDGDVVCDSKLLKHSKADDCMNIGNGNEDKDGYYGTVAHGDVYLDARG